MAQNVKIAGATYSAVPAVLLPKADNSGNARYTDTSDATATADKILQGYSAYGADGTKLIGTNQGGGATAYVSGEILYITGGLITPA